MSLRKHISNTITCREIEVEHQGDKFLFRALGDASTYAKAFLQDPRTLATDKAHYGRVLKSTYGDDDAKLIDINDELVRAIRLVHTTLVAAEWDVEKKEWIPLKDPYDIVEILQIAVEQGTLFHSVLTSGALQAMGYTEDVLKGYNENQPLEAALAGNSSAVPSDQ